MLYPIPEGFNRKSQFYSVHLAGWSMGLYRYQEEETSGEIDSQTFFTTLVLQFAKSKFCILTEQAPPL